MGSFMMRIIAVTNIIIEAYPSSLKPEGLGKRIKANPIIIAKINHLFCLAQKRKLLTDKFENPSNKTPCYVYLIYNST